MKKLTQIMEVFTLGIGRVIASGYAMRNCIPFLQTGYMDALDWIASHGVQYRYVTHINFEVRDKWFDNSISVMNALTMQDTRSDEEIREQLWNDNNPENCDGCANVDRWFIERAHEFEFHPFVTTCSMCSEREAFYVGVTQHGTPFEFCCQCRDQLQTLKIERTQSSERFGV